MARYDDGRYREAYMKQENGSQEQQKLQGNEQQRSFGAGLGSQDARAQGDKWQQAFLRVAAAVGVQAQQQGGSDPDTEAVLQAVQALQQSEQHIRALQQQEAALQVQVAHLTLQNMELRRELGSGWSAAEPSVLQVRQMVLDPAIQQAFARMRHELEDQRAVITQLKEQNDSLTFTADSKMGRALINKTKLLAEENQEMAMQLKDGPAASQGALLAIERHHANELRKGISEIRDHCTFLEEENEELNMLRFLNERQIQDLQAPAALPDSRQERTERDNRDIRDREGNRDRDIRDRDARDGVGPRAYHGSGGRRGGGHVGPGGRGHTTGRGGRGEGSYSQRGRGRGDGGGRFALSGHKRMR